jgi:hypothetical protein
MSRNFVPRCWLLRDLQENSHAIDPETITATAIPTSCAIINAITPPRALCLRRLPRDRALNRIKEKAARREP